jgi:hypothetical protein
VRRSGNAGDGDAGQGSVDRKKGGAGREGVSR